MLTTLTILSREQGQLYGKTTSTEAMTVGIDGHIARRTNQAGALARSWIGRLARRLAASTLGAARPHSLG